MTNGRVLVPAGGYILAERLSIKKSNSSCAARAGKTILCFRRPLAEVGVGGTSWSFNSGSITTQGTNEGPVIGIVAADAPKGAQKLPVSASTGVQARNWMRIIQTNQGRQPVPRPVRRHAPGQRQRGRRHRGVPASSPR